MSTLFPQGSVRSGIDNSRSDVHETVLFYIKSLRINHEIFSNRSRWSHRSAFALFGVYCFVTIVSAYVSRWNFSCNVLGSFVFGFLFEMFQLRITGYDNLRLFIFVGFLGAFTTFSTYSFETVMFLKNQQYKHAILNLFLNNILCLVFVILGYILARNASLK